MEEARQYPALIDVLIPLGVLLAALVLLWRCVWLINQALRTGVSQGAFGNYERAIRPVPFWTVIVSNVVLSLLCLGLIWAALRDIAAFL